MKKTSQKDQREKRLEEIQVLYYKEHNISNTLSSQQTTKRSDQLLDSWLVNMSSSA